MRTQVDRNHYGVDYLSPEKFQLYYHILRTVLAYKPNNVLEIGLGTGVVAHLLRFNGVNVVCGDFDVSLDPDVLFDIRQCPFKCGSFDVVLASQVLEHIPFEDVSDAVCSMAMSAKKGIVISVPYNRHNVSLSLNVKFNRYLRFRGAINTFIDRFLNFYVNCGIDQSSKSFVPDREHRWEIGYKEYPLSRVRAAIERACPVETEFRVPRAPYHYVFALRRPVRSG